MKLGVLIQLQHMFQSLSTKTYGTRTKVIYDDILEPVLDEIEGFHKALKTLAEEKKVPLEEVQTGIPQSHEHYEAFKELQTTYFEADSKVEPKPVFIQDDMYQEKLSLAMKRQLKELGLWKE